MKAERVKTTETTEEVSSHPGEKRAWEPKNASKHPVFQRKAEDGLEKRLANLWRGKNITKKAHAGRGQESKWEMSMKAVLTSTVAVITLCGCAASPVRIPGEGVRSKPLPYPEFSQYLESREQVPVSAIDFQRDSVGSKLFITFFFRKGNEPAYRTLIVTRDGIKEVPGYHIVWYEDQENPLFRLEGGKEWYEDEGKSYRFFSRFEDANYIFRGGSAIPFEAIWANIIGVSGGDFVVLQFRDKPGWTVSAPENPRQPVIELPKDLDHPQRAYATTDELIIFGTWRPGQSGHLVKCLVYQKSSAGYRLSEEIPIPWGGSVYDMDLKTGDALITSTATKFASYYRFNIRTKRRARLGFAPSDDVLFLKEDVIRTLDAAMREGK